jgi:hypothetical protein
MKITTDNQSSPNLYVYYLFQGDVGMDKVGLHFSRGNGVLGMLPFKYLEESWRYERWAGERG